MLVTCYGLPAFLVLGYATVYEYLNEDICVGTGVNRQISLNVCHEQQLLNPDDSQLSDSQPQELTQERHLQEDPEEESSSSSNPDEIDSVAMPDLSMYEALAMNITQQHTYVKFNCMKGNKTKSVSPVASPSLTPTLTPTHILTIPPSAKPTYLPSATPSNTPSVVPSYLRSYTPTVEETYNPTEVPTQEPTVIPTIEPTLKVGETRAPIRTPTARPSASPSFQAFPVISFDSSRNMSLDAKSTSAVTTNSADGDAFRRAMCATQLKSQGLGSDASCSLKGRVEQQQQSVSLLASLFQLSKGLVTTNLIPNHFRGEATNDATVVIDFNSQVNMVNYKNTSVSAFLNKIVTSSQSFSPRNFTQTLKKQAKAAGVTGVTVTGVGSSYVIKNSVVVVSPPTFSPTATPTSATPTIASPTRTPLRSSNKDKLSVGAIIGIVIGGAVFILIVVCILFHKYLAGARKERKSDRQKVYIEY